MPFVIGTIIVITFVYFLYKRFRKKPKEESEKDGYEELPEEILSV